MKHGIGILKFANQDVYQGDFVRDDLHGKGTYRYHNGDVFEGSFKKGKREGPGTFLGIDGRLQIGTWVNDKFEVWGGKRSGLVVLVAGGVDVLDIAFLEGVVGVEVVNVAGWARVEVAGLGLPPLLVEGQGNAGLPVSLFILLFLDLLHEVWMFLRVHDLERFAIVAPRCMHNLPN
jgi:hypothetical protein